jgi:hypothetical protein
MELGGWLACPRRPNCLTRSMILVTPGQLVRSGSRSITDGSGDSAWGLLESSPITHEEISLTSPCWSWALAPPFSPSDSLPSRQSLAPLPPLSLHLAPCRAPSRHPVTNPFFSSLNRPCQLPLKARLNHILQSTRSEGQSFAWSHWNLRREARLHGYSPDQCTVCVCVCVWCWSLQIRPRNHWFQF